MNRSARFGIALVTYTAAEQITSDVLEDAYSMRPARGIRAPRLDISEMHTRTMDNIHYMAIRFRPTQSRSSFQSIIDHVRPDLQVQLTQIPDSHRSLYMGLPEINCPHGVIIRNIIRDDGLPMRHSFFAHGRVPIHRSIIREGQIPHSQLDVNVNIRYIDEGVPMEQEPVPVEAMARMFAEPAVAEPEPEPAVIRLEAAVRALRGDLPATSASLQTRIRRLETAVRALGGDV